MNNIAWNLYLYINYLIFIFTGHSKTPKVPRLNLKIKTILSDLYKSIDIYRLEIFIILIIFNPGNNNRTRTKKYNFLPFWKFLKILSDLLKFFNHFIIFLSILKTCSINIFSCEIKIRKYCSYFGPPLIYRVNGNSIEI